MIRSLAIFCMVLLSSCNADKQELEALYDMKKAHELLIFNFDAEGRDGECVTFWKVLEKVSEKNKPSILRNLKNIECEEYIYTRESDRKSWFIRIKRKNGSVFFIP